MVQRHDSHVLQCLRYDPNHKSSRQAHNGNSMFANYSSICEIVAAMPPLGRIPFSSLSCDTSVANPLANPLALRCEREREKTRKKMKEKERKGGCSMIVCDT